MIGNIKIFLVSVCVALSVFALEAANTVNHTIARGETLYSIGKRYGMSVDEILALNPGLHRTKYKAGDVIKIADGAEQSVAIEERQPVEEVIPDAIEVEPVEQDRVEQEIIEPEPSYLKPVERERVADVVETVEECISDGSEPLNIAIMLPFMLSDDNPPKQALHYTDFYKGFVLAADSLSDSGRKVRIFAYDTCNNVDSVKMIMRSPGFERLHVIVAPNDSVQFAAITKVAARNKAYVFNPFYVKDLSYQANSWVMQANIPQEDMYCKAIANFIDQFDEVTPVFLSQEGRKCDKRKFIDEMKLTMSENDIHYEEITYKVMLDSLHLDTLVSGNKYVFIPESSARGDFSKIAPALKVYKDENPDAVTLFGYPEWVTFRGEQQDMLHELNTTIYCRFYNDKTSVKTSDLQDKFMRYYGKYMIETEPSQGVLGFDAGYFLINLLRDTKGDFSDGLTPYDGVQSGFDFIGVDGGGYVNYALYFVNFRKGGVIEKVKLL